MCETFTLLALMAEYIETADSATPDTMNRCSRHVSHSHDMDYVTRVLRNLALFKLYFRL